MLTKYDELLCHQTVATFDNVGSSAREWTERIWCHAHDREGKMQIVAGFGQYANRNIMDAFVCCIIDNSTQYVVRASRELRPQIDEVRVNPFSYDVLEPLKKVRCALGENEYGISYDIELDGTMPPHEEEAQHFLSRGRVVEHVQRYSQVGRPGGWIKIEGKIYEIDPATWLSERDRSWGIRRGAVESQETGVQPTEIPPGGMYSGTFSQFENWGFCYHTRENWQAKPMHFAGSVFYPYGSGKEDIKLVKLEHDFQFRTDIPGIRQVKSGKVALTTEEGENFEVSLRPLSACYIGTGGYSRRGYRGFIHGLWMGSYYIDGFKLDLTNPEVAREASYLEDLMCELRCGDEVGYGMFEVNVSGKFPKYGFEGY